MILKAAYISTDAEALISFTAPQAAELLLQMQPEPEVPGWWVETVGLQTCFRLTLYVQHDLAHEGAGRHNKRTLIAGFREQA